MHRPKVSTLVLIVAALLLLFGTAAWAGDNGISFQSAIEGNVVNFNASENGTALAIVNDADEGLILYRSADAGKSWEKAKWLVDNAYLEQGDIASVNDIAFLPGGTAFILGERKSGTTLFIKSADGGKRWESIKTSAAPLNIEAVGSDLLGVFKMPQQDLTILRVSNDGGETWNDLKTSVADNDGGLLALDEKTYIAVLENGNVSVTLDSGKTWNDAGVKLSGKIVNYHTGAPSWTVWGKVAGAIEPDGSKTVAACGPGATGQVYISNGLTKWTRIDSNCFEWRKNYTASRVTCIAVAPNGVLLAGTPDNCLLASGDGGSTWTPVTQGVRGEISKIKCFTVNGNIIAMMLQDNSLVRSEFPASALLPAKSPEQPSATPPQPENVAARFVVGSKSYYASGKPFDMDAAPFIENGRTFVPVRFLAYALGVPDSGIVWSPSAKTVSLRKDNVIVEMAVGGNILYVNSQRQQMDVSPVIQDGRVYLPARFVAEAFGYEVSWDPAAATVLVQPKNK